MSGFLILSAIKDLSHLTYYQKQNSILAVDNLEEIYVGDLMAVTLANILNHPIVIFTSSPNMPLLCLTPLNGGPVSSNIPLLLTFLQNGPGHYDYAVCCESPSEHKKLRCTCGRKRNYKGMACSTPRCACMIASMPCTSLCTCKCCTNSHGKHPPPSHKCKRSVYDNSKAQPLAGSNIDSFLSSAGEEITSGYLTLLEDILLKFLLVYIFTNGIEISPQNLQQIYMKIYNLSKLCTTIDFPLFERTIEEIEFSEENV